MRPRIRSSIPCWTMSVVPVCALVTAVAILSVHVSAQVEDEVTRLIVLSADANASVRRAAEEKLLHRSAFDLRAALQKIRNRDVLLYIATSGAVSPLDEFAEQRLADLAADDCISAPERFLLWRATARARLAMTLVFLKPQPDDQKQSAVRRDFEKFTRDWLGSFPIEISDTPRDGENLVHVDVFARAVASTYSMGRNYYRGAQATVRMAVYDSHGCVHTVKIVQREGPPRQIFVERSSISSPSDAPFTMAIERAMSEALNHLRR